MGFVSITSELTKVVQQEILIKNERYTRGLLFGPSPLVPAAALVQPQEGLEC